MAVVAKEIDYQKLSYSYPSYTYTKLIQQTGGGTVNLTTAGGNDSVFEIPAKVFNLDKSYLSFNMLIAEKDTKYMWTTVNAITQFQQLQLYTRNSVMLADIQNLQNYTNLSVLPKTTYDELKSYPQYGSSATGANQSYSNIFMTSNALASASYRPNGNTSELNYDEVRYIIVGAQGDGDGAGNLTLKIQIPMSLFKDTILSLDKDLFFDEVILLRFVWGPTGKIAWFSDAANNPTTNATATDAAITISGLAFYLALEENLEIQMNVMNRVRSEGLQVMIPYVWSYKQSIATSTSQNITLRYNRAQGIKLMKVIHSLYNSVETANTAYDHANYTTAGSYGVKVSNFYTQLDNMRRQQFNVDCTLGEDYLLLKDKLRGSGILSHQIYAYNWFWIEDFSNIKAPIDFDTNEQNLISGLDLAQERKLDFYFTTASATFYHYSYAVTLRLLNIKPGNIFLDGQMNL